MLKLFRYILSEIGHRRFKPGDRIRIMQDFGTGRPSLVGCTGVVQIIGTRFKNQPWPIECYVVIPDRPNPQNDGLSDPHCGWWIPEAYLDHA